MALSKTLMSGSWLQVLLRISGTHLPEIYSELHILVRDCQSEATIYQGIGIWNLAFLVFFWRKSNEPKINMPAE